jgi:predicted O-methyltransferase YrrM
MTAEPGRLAAYLAALFAREDAALTAAREAHRRADLPAIFVSAEEGAVLHLLPRMVGARRVLEVGTLGGYSGIWLARALPPDGRLVTIEGDEGHAAVARAAFEGPFDAVFLDADKAPLRAYLDEALRLVRVGGLILCDNTFMHGRVADPGADEVAA